MSDRPAWGLHLELGMSLIWRPAFPIFLMHRRCIVIVPQVSQERGGMGGEVGKYPYQPLSLCMHLPIYKSSRLIGLSGQVWALGLLGAAISAMCALECTLSDLPAVFFFVFLLFRPAFSFPCSSSCHGECSGNRSRLLIC